MKKISSNKLINDGANLVATKAIGSEKEELNSRVNRIRKLEHESLKNFINIGYELSQIQKKELYRHIKLYSFADFVEKHLPFSRQHAYRLIQAYEVYTQLEPLSKESIALPYSEAHIRPLLDIPTDQRLDAWRKIVKDCEESKIPITRQVVEHYAQNPSSFSVKEIEDIPEETIESNGHLEAVVEEDEYIALEVQESLHKISKICKVDVQQAIQDGLLVISDQNIIKWAQQTDAEIDQIGWYLMNNQWTFSASFDYVQNGITDYSKIRDLISVAMTRPNGNFAIKADQYAVVAMPYDQYQAFLESVVNEDRSTTLPEDSY